jgi:hypothetical protein
VAESGQWPAPSSGWVLGRGGGVFAAGRGAPSQDARFGLWRRYLSACLRVPDAE